MTYDKEDMLSVLERFPEQCREAVKIAKGYNITGKFKNICVCGMGGSGIVGDLIASLLKNIPVYVHHNYGLPSYITKDSLVIIVSYSGNTAETLSAYTEAKKRKIKIVAVTSGGKLAEKEKNSIMIPSGMEPKESIAYLLMPIIVALSNNKIIPNQNSSISEAIRLLIPKEASRAAFLLAKNIFGKIPIIYASEDLKGIAYRMKCEFNENSKQPAFYNVFPEMNHNELSGFERLGNKVIVIFIKDDKDLVSIKKRMLITKKLIKDQTNVAEIEVKGKSQLAKILTTMYVGDFTSYYLALMNKVDPTPTPIVTELKKKL